MTAICAQFVNSGIIVTVHFPIIVAILIEFLHIVLHAVGGAARIVRTVDEGILRVGLITICGQFARIHPVGPSNAEDAAGALIWVGADGGPIAARDCLAKAIEAQLRNRLIQHVTLHS